MVGVPLTPQLPHLPNTPGSRAAGSCRNAALGLPAPAPTPLPPPPGKTRPLQCKHVPPSRLLGRPRPAGEDPVPPNPLRRRGWERGQPCQEGGWGAGGSRSPNPQCPGVPPDPATSPQGNRPRCAGLRARRDGASVSRLLLRNADESENAAFPPRSNAWPRITPAPSPKAPPHGAPGAAPHPEGATPASVTTSPGQGCPAPPQKCRQAELPCSLAAPEGKSQPRPRKSQGGGSRK